MVEMNIPRRVMERTGHDVLINFIAKKRIVEMYWEYETRQDKVCKRQQPDTKIRL